MASSRTPNQSWLVDGGHQSDYLDPRDLAGGFAAQQVLYQAQGMVMVDLNVSFAEAVARLRGHADDHHERVSDVARTVVDGRLRLSPMHDSPWPAAGFAAGPGA